METFVYEMVKKYKGLDIAVVYKTADSKQLERLQKYCPVYKHTNETINCKVAIINYDVTIIDYITPDIWRENANEDEGIFQVVHADYENAAYTWKPPTDERIKSYIAITKHIEQSFKKLVGVDNVIQGYNPIVDEEDDKIVLVSATRLSRIKGKSRMIKLMNALDMYNVNYIWYIFTNDTDAIQNENIIYMKPRLDVRHWIKNATYLVQLSDTERRSI